MERTADSTSSTNASGRRPRAASRRRAKSNRGLRLGEDSEPRVEEGISGVPASGRRPRAASRGRAKSNQKDAERVKGEVTVGRVAGAHGLGGELRVQLLGTECEDLRALGRVCLASQPRDPSAFEARVRAVRVGRADEALLCLEGVADRDAAEALRGRFVLCDPEQLPRPAPGEYYQYELVGCRVEDAEGRALGVVSGVWETGASDVLVVRDGEREHLIPAAGPILKVVDPAAGRIVVDPPPGLLGGDTEPEPEP